MDNAKEIIESIAEEIHEHKVNERLQLGYTREQWKKLKRCHNAMDHKIELLLSDYFTNSAISDFSKEERNTLFIKTEMKWKNFVREVIINSYPMSGNETTKTQTRLRLLNIFKNRVESIESKLGLKKE